MGVFMMIGALVFLGCPLRDVLRMAGGDFNAVVGFIGFIAGVGSGVFFLRRGFNLGRAESSHSNAGGLLLPIIFVFFLFLLLKATVFNPVRADQYSSARKGRVPWLLGDFFVGRVVVGFLAQRTRLCLSGGIRDFILIGIIIL